MTHDDPAGRVSLVSRLLRERGQHDASADLEATLGRHKGGGLLEALRETCQTLLTAVESLDPASFAAIEELRLDIDRRLNTGKSSG